MRAKFELLEKWLVCTGMELLGGGIKGCRHIMEAIWSDWDGWKNNSGESSNPTMLLIAFPWYKLNAAHPIPCLSCFAHALRHFHIHGIRYLLLGGPLSEKRSSVAFLLASSDANSFTYCSGKFAQCIALILEHGLLCCSLRCFSTRTRTFIWWFDHANVTWRLPPPIDSGMNGA